MDGKRTETDLKEQTCEAGEVVVASLDDALHPFETDDVVSVGVDDLYFLETDSVVSAGLDGFVLHVPPSEAYLAGDQVLYFSSTLACMVPARIAGPGGFCLKFWPIYCAKLPVFKIEPYPPAKPWNGFRVMPEPTLRNPKSRP